MTLMRLKKPFLLLAFFPLFLALAGLASGSTSPLVNVGKIVADVLAPGPQPKKLTFAVAPFHTNDPLDPMGRKVQQQMLDLLKSIWPEASVVEAPRAATSQADAQALVESSGLDWVLWGAEEKKKDIFSTWSFGISFSDRFSNLIQQIGQGPREDVYLEHVPAKDLSTLMTLVLKNSTYTLGSMNEKITAQDMLQQIKESDSFLEAAAKEGFDPPILRLVQKTEAALLSTYGFLNDDYDSKHRALKIFEDLIENTPDNRAEEKSNYGLALGLLEAALGHSEKSIEDLEKARTGMDPVLYSRRAQTIDYFIALDHESAGFQNVDEGEIRKGIQGLEDLLAKLNKTDKLDLWVFTQNSLGNAYMQLGQAEMDDKSNRLSLEHLLAALGEAKGHLSLPAIAILETDLSQTYSRLGGKDRSLDDLEEAVTTAQGAVDIYRSLKKDFPLALSLTVLSEAEQTLASATYDADLFTKAKNSLEESLKLVPKGQNTRLWAANEIDLIMLGTTTAIKTCSPTAAQETLKTIQDVRESYPDINQLPALYISETALLQLEGAFNCDEKAAKDSLADIGKIEALPKSKNNPALAETLAEMKAAELDIEGFLNQDPVRLRSAIALMRTSLGSWPEGSNSQDRCDLLGNLGDTYRDLLLVQATPEDRKGGHEILDWMKDCSKSLFPGEAKEKLLEQAELASVLAVVEKDPKGLAEGLRLCGEVSDFFVQNGELFNEAKRQEVMGQDSLALWELTQNPENLKQAADFFSKAQILFKDFGPCQAVHTEEGLAKIKAVQKQ